MFVEIRFVWVSLLLRIYLSIAEKYTMRFSGKRQSIKSPRNNLRKSRRLKSRTNQKNIRNKRHVENPQRNNLTK